MRGKPEFVLAWNCSPGPGLTWHYRAPSMTRQDDEDAQQVATVKDSQLAKRAFENSASVLACLLAWSVEMETRARALLLLLLLLGAAPSLN